MKEANGKHEEPKPFDRFQELTKRLVAVPKKEIDRKEAAYQRRKARRKQSA